MENKPNGPGKVPARIERKYVFNPADFAAIPFETPETVANLVAEAVARYQPTDSQELFTVERIALAQLSLLRCGMLENGRLQADPNEATTISAGKLLRRMRKQAERRLHDAIEYFERLKSQRDERPAKQQNEPIQSPIRSLSAPTIVYTTRPFVTERPLRPWSGPYIIVNN